MKNGKTLPLLLLASILTVSSAIAFTLSRPTQSAREAVARPALKQDFVSPSGEKILEVAEATYEATENAFRGSSCRVRNLSGRDITALGLLWTVTLSDGETSQIQQLVDYRLHKDIAEAKAVRPFSPYEEKVFPRTTHEVFDGGRSIVSVGVEFLFAEFEGSGGVGIKRSKPYKDLLLKREGAEIYKRWMEAAYRADPQKMDKLAGKLAGEEMPADQRLSNGLIRQGALSYRQWMRGAFKDKGADSLRPFLSQE